jgi:hypothetical protein
MTMVAPELAAEIPAALRERMRVALADARAGGAPDGSGPGEMLARAALDCLRLVLASSGERESALDLLAADALLTDAVAAAAERGPAALAAFAEESLARIAALLPESGVAP